MTQTIAAIRVPPLGEPPLLAPWVVHRERLARRLDRGVSGSVTLVTAPPGWGKTLGVASWAASTSVPEDVVWLSVAGAAADPGLLPELLREALVEEGARDLAPVPPAGSPEGGRPHALARLGRSLSRGPRRVLVLDDYPTGEVGPLGRDLSAMLEHSRCRLSLVLISRGQPAFPVQRHRVASDLTGITLTDLAMDWLEVAGVLAGHEVVAEEPTARTVQRHTDGWPVGVRLAALALRDVCSVEAALEEADRATVDLLVSEVLREAPAHLRRLLVRTSMVDEVDRDLARAVGGPAAETAMTPAAASESFVELRDDLSFRCPPLLRAAAAAELAREPRELREEATRRAAQWHVDHDRLPAGLEIAMSAGDWPWVGRALIQACVVPQILSGGVSEAVGRALAARSVRAAEPLVDAALSLRSGGPDAADAALKLLERAGPASDDDVAAELAALCVRLAVARGRGDTDHGTLVAARVRELVPRLPIERQPELIAFLEAHAGALAASDGQLSLARTALLRGAAIAGADRGRAAALDCRGQRALLDAVQGNLRAAELQAAATLRSADAAAFASTAHAHLAAAWVHVERTEQVLARQHLDRAAEAASDGAEPWYGTARLLAEARLLVATDQPEAALRLLAAADTSPAGCAAGWGAALLTLATADALVATGEPSSALPLVVPGHASTPVENSVLAARALVALGDAPGARRALAAVSPDLSAAPLDVQVEHWLLAARLAEEAGSSERARLLVGRALRASAREQLRRPCARESRWLVPLVEQDAPLRREHGGFLARITTASAGRSVRVARQAASAPLLVEKLTAREAQVLGMLADMCSTEEIARELFLSVNTVKTYIRGILRKLAVNRRVDAVRRGRELGLC